LILLIGGGSLGWIGYRAERQSALDHDLILATASGSPERVEAMLSQGADPNAREDHNREIVWRHFLDLLLRRKLTRGFNCPLSQALAPGYPDANHLKIVRILLEHHANPNVSLLEGYPLPTRGVEGPLTKFPPDDALLTLLLEHGANPDTLDGAGTPLLMAAVYSSHLSQVQLLLDHGANPNLKAADGNTALMWAAYNLDTKTVDLLLAHRADVNSKDKNGLTALMYALINIKGSHTAAIRSLLAAGADVNVLDQKSWSPFLFALNTRADQVYPLELKEWIDHSADVRAAVPASGASRNVGVQMRLQNVGNGSSISLGATPGTTPLMFAVRCKDRELTHKILEKGADVNARDSKGNTALKLCSNAPEIRALLLRAGAHP